MDWWVNFTYLLWGLIHLQVRIIFFYEVKVHVGKKQNKRTWLFGANFEWFSRSKLKERASKFSF